MQHKGRITTWKDDKGFGFITPEQGGEQVFFHVSDVTNKQYRPSVDTLVTYTLTYDDRQHPRAINVQLTTIPTYPTAIVVPLFVCGVVLVAMIGATFLLKKSPLIPSAYVLVSIFTFLAYYIDKSSAMRTAWRVPERRLHILELLGGWPGALVAQHYYRHKTTKLSYQVSYWMIVVIHVGVLVWYYGTP